MTTNHSMHEFLHNPADFFVIPQVGLWKNLQDYAEIHTCLKHE